MLRNSRTPVGSDLQQSDTESTLTATTATPAEVPSTRKRSRRQLLRGAAGGLSVGAGAALLPDHWVKPVVDSVVLPAHAQATLPPSGFQFSCGALTVVCNPSVPNLALFDLVLDVQGVAAGVGASPAGAVIEITITGATQDAGNPLDVQSTSMSTTTVVQPDESFATIWNAPPPAGRIWMLDVTNTFNGTLVTRYQDAGTFGGATCNTTFTCTQVFP